MNKNYGVGDLKKEFRDLKGVKDFTLVPVFDIVAGKWISRLPKNPNITDYKEIDYGGIYSSSSLICVVGGKIVKATLDYAEIDVVDDDESWKMIRKMSFHSSSSGALTRVCDDVREFAGSQDLEALMKDARKNLERGKTHHLSREMHDFYFPE